MSLPDFKQMHQDLADIQQLAEARVREAEARGRREAFVEVRLWIMDGIYPSNEANKMLLDSFNAAFPRPAQEPGATPSEKP